MNRLIILGAGGYGKTVADVAAQLGYTQIAFLDDMRTGEKILGICEDFKRLADGNTEMYPAFGNNEYRIRWMKRLLEADIRVPSFVHPRAYVSPTVKIAAGCVILPQAAVNTDVKLEMGCIINLGAIVDHDCVICEGAHLAPGAIVKAENRIRPGFKINSGEVVENRQYPL